MRNRLADRLFQVWLDAPLHGLRERALWTLYRLLRGWGRLYGLDRHTAAVNALRVGVDR